MILAFAMGEKEETRPTSQRISWNVFGNLAASKAWQAAENAKTTAGMPSNTETKIGRATDSDGHAWQSLLYLR